MYIHYFTQVKEFSQRCIEEFFYPAAVKQSWPGGSGFVNSFFHMIFLAVNEIVYVVKLNGHQQAKQ
ncbi:MAG: hypothetical protein C4308_05465 [Chitinophagaceae bacterium]